MSKPETDAKSSCPQCAAEGESESYPFGPVSFDVCKARELVLLYPREKKLWSRQHLEDLWVCPSLQ